MLSNYTLLNDKEKLSILRAFFSLKANPDFQKITAFLSDVDQEITTNLRTLPLDQILKEQGKAQLIFELNSLLDLAKESEIHRLRNQ